MTSVQLVGLNEKLIQLLTATELTSIHTVDLSVVKQSKWLATGSTQLRNEDATVLLPIVLACRADQASLDLIGLGDLLFLHRFYPVRDLLIVHVVLHMVLHDEDCVVDFHADKLELQPPDVIVALGNAAENAVQADEVDLTLMKKLKGFYI